MNRYVFRGVVLALCCLGTSTVFAKEELCFESRKGASEVTPHKLREGRPSVKCSPKTGAVLWWDDPFAGTVAMPEVPTARDHSGGVAVVRPREDKLTLMPVCGVACHNGSVPPPPKDKNPRALAMHKDVVPDALDLQHGRGAIWCLDCHHPSTRNKLMDNFGRPISFNEPQKLCGKCHGDVLRDWRDGIHGKRIGEWASDGKKRWFVCTECHNPHDVQQGARGSGFAQIEPEHAPVLPKGLRNADHERDDNHGATPTGATGFLEQLMRWLRRISTVARRDPVPSLPRARTAEAGDGGARLGPARSPEPRDGIRGAGVRDHTLAVDR